MAGMCAAAVVVSWGSVGGLKCGGRVDMIHLTLKELCGALSTGRVWSRKIDRGQWRRGGDHPSMSGRTAVSPPPPLNNTEIHTSHLVTPCTSAETIRGVKLSVRALIGLAWPLLRSPGSLTAVNSTAAAAAAALRAISSSRQTGFRPSTLTLGWSSVHRGEG